MTTRPNRTKKLNLGLTPRRQADCRSFDLDAERWQAFLAALDAPPNDMPRMRQLINEPSIFSSNGPA